MFDEDTILNKPIEEWPIVNGFVSFFSHGFPLEKAIAYKNLRNPFIVNDLEMQYTLQDRQVIKVLYFKLVFFILRMFFFLINKNCTHILSKLLKFFSKINRSILNSFKKCNFSSKC